MLAGITVTITGCGSDNAAAPTPPPIDKVGTVENNHGHSATITSAQQMAGGGLTLSIQGTSSHQHLLELTAQEVVRIRFGDPLSKQSTLERGHVHTVIFNQPTAG